MTKLRNRDLLLPYALPFMAYLAIASVPLSWLGDSQAASYALRITAAAAALYWGARHYVSLLGPRSTAGSVGAGALAGVIGIALWLTLLLPFVDDNAAAPWPAAGFALRLIATSLLVPVFEELLMRGYVLRVAVLWDRARRAGVPDPLVAAMDRDSIEDVEPGAWTPLAVAISTVLFAVGHTPAEWPAACAYGALMAGLWIVRRDLLSCVIAHAVTNAGLALYVLQSGQWALW